MGLQFQLAGRIVAAVTHHAAVLQDVPRLLDGNCGGWWWSRLFGGGAAGFRRRQVVQVLFFTFCAHDNRAVGECILVAGFIGQDCAADIQLRVGTGVFFLLGQDCEYSDQDYHQQQRAGLEKLGFVHVLWSALLTSARACSH